MARLRRYPVRMRSIALLSLLSMAMEPLHWVLAALSCLAFAPAVLSSTSSIGAGLGLLAGSVATAWLGRVLVLSPLRGERMRNASVTALVAYLAALLLSNLQFTVAANGREVVTIHTLGRDIAVEGTHPLLAAIPVGWAFSGDSRQWLLLGFACGSPILGVAVLRASAAFRPRGFGARSKMGPLLPRGAARGSLLRAHLRGMGRSPPARSVWVMAAISCAYLLVRRGAVYRVAWLPFACSALVLGIGSSLTEGLRTMGVRASRGWHLLGTNPVGVCRARAGAWLMVVVAPIAPLWVATLVIHGFAVGVNLALYLIAAAGLILSAGNLFDTLGGSARVAKVVFTVLPLAIAGRRWDLRSWGAAGFLALACLLAAVLWARSLRWVATRLTSFSSQE